MLIAFGALRWTHSSKQIKDLLNAEKELGIWRTKIEELEGEIRYYGNQVALSTLNISLYEKEIRAPSVITEANSTKAVAVMVNLKRMNRGSR